MMCLGVFLFGFNFFGTLCAFWTYMSISFTRIGKFSFIIFSNKVSILCSSSSPSGTPLIQMLVHVKSSHRFLILPLLFWIVSYSILVECLILPFVPNHWFESHLHSLHCRFPVYFPLFCLVYLSFLPLFCGHTKWVLWVSWSPVFWTLHLMGCLSPFQLVLFLEICSVLSFEPYFFAFSIWWPPCVCFCVLGKATFIPLVAWPV